MSIEIGVGTKVVCIDDTELPGSVAWDPAEKITRGRIYTITSVHDHLGDLVVWLAEAKRCKSAIDEWGPLVGYGIFRFRPVRLTRKDTEMLEWLDLDLKVIERGKINA